MSIENQQVVSAEPFVFHSLKEVLNAPEESVPYVVDQLLPSSGLSVLAGKPKAGKTTLVRQLAVAVAQGKPFLERPTEKGAVLYFALEEKLQEVKTHFHQLGAQPEDPIMITHGAVIKGAAVDRLEASLRATENVQLVIIDPLFRFIGVKDSNEYIPVSNALEKLLMAAREHGTHIVMVHHMKKKQADDAMDEILGSTAIAAAVDTIMSLRVGSTGVRMFSTRQRYGSNLQETELIWDADRRQISLGLSAEEAQRSHAQKTRSRIESEMLRYINEHPGCTQEQLMNTVTGNKSLKLRVFQSLLDLRSIEQSGEGVKGAPYSYRRAEIPVEQPPVFSACEA